MGSLRTSPLTAIHIPENGTHILRGESKPPGQLSAPKKPGQLPRVPPIPLLLLKPRLPTFPMIPTWVLFSHCPKERFDSDKHFHMKAWVSLSHNLLLCFRGLYFFFFNLKGRAGVMSVDGMSNPSSSGLRWADGNWKWRQCRRGWEWLGGPSRGSTDPCSGWGGLGAPESDSTVIQTRFMCSAAECGRAEAGDREIFQRSDP